MALRRILDDLRDFLGGPVGGRFEARFHRKRGERLTLGARLGWLACGVALLLVGALLMIFPGPGIPLVALGLACVAQESLALARWCDRAEVAARARYTRWREARERR